MQNLAQAIPAKISTVISSILAMAVGLQAILDVVPADVANKTIDTPVIHACGGAGSAHRSTDSP